jgi:DNA-binding NtrC family response regulator
MKQDADSSQPASHGLLAQMERNTIMDSLARNKGDRKAAAEELGISLRTLQYRLKEYGISGRN